GLIIIDQHRAHVKILYEQYIKKITEGEQVSQRIMFPETLSLDPEHQAALEEVDSELKRLGFDIESEKEGKWRIIAVPVMLKDSDCRDVILRILDSVGDGGENYGNEGDISGNILSRVALVMARSMAIKRGKRLTCDEMEHLIGELFSLPDPAYTPNGNPVYCVFDSRRLDMMFRG
ncbi:MAG: hypothetical protein K2F94_07280, partial [Muribaculaceae bacterium]|nr:hypothetical protein [Muribaculaceae bacterium]